MDEYSLCTRMTACEACPVRNMSREVGRRVPALATLAGIEPGGEVEDAIFTQQILRSYSGLVLEWAGIRQPTEEDITNIVGAAMNKVIGECQ